MAASSHGGSNSIPVKWNNCMVNSISVKEPSGDGSRQKLWHGHRLWTVFCRRFLSHQRFMGVLAQVSCSALWHRQQQSRSRLAPKWQYLLRHLLLRTVCPPAPRNWVYLNQSDGSLDAHVRTRTFEHAPKLCACVHYRNSLRMCRSIFQAGNLISPSNMKSSLLLVWLGCEWTLELLLNDESNKPGVFNSEEKLWKQNVSATRVHMLPIASQLEATQCAYRVQFNLCRQKFAKQVSWSFESQRCEIMVQQNRYASWSEAYV